MIALALLAACLCSCSAPQFDAAAMVQEWAAFMQKDYVLRPGDEVTINVYEHEDLTQTQIVTPDGTISLRRIENPLSVGGVSVAMAQKRVQQAYADVVKEPEVSLSLSEVAASSVYVAGEVRRAGPVPYVSGMTLTQAIAEAGGYVITAKSEDVRVLRNVGSEGAKTYRVNVWDTLHDEAPDFLVLPGDVVFCQTSAIADVGNWVTLYIARLLPFPPSAAVIP